MENINFNKYFFIVAIFIASSCSSYKDTLKKGKGTIDDVIDNVVIDYYHTDKKERENSDIFILQNKTLDEQPFYTILIGSYINKVILRPDHGIDSLTNYIPTQYKLYNKKLFIWNDSIVPINQETLNILDKFDRIDSTYIKLDKGLLDSNSYVPPKVIIHDGLDYKIYTICKKDISKYKSLKANNSIPFKTTKLPKVNCD